MNIKDILKDEMKRLNRRNDLLEKTLNTGNSNIAIEETIKGNALAMCEIAKAYKLFV